MAEQYKLARILPKTVPTKSNEVYFIGCKNPESVLNMLYADGNEDKVRSYGFDDIQTVEDRDIFRWKLVRTTPTLTGGVYNINYSL